MTFFVDQPGSYHPPGSLNKIPKGFSIGFWIAENKLSDQQTFMILTHLVSFKDFTNESSFYVVLKPKYNLQK